MIILFADDRTHASNACMTQSITHLEKLISFNTVSRDSNLALIDHVSALLEPLGFRVQLAPSEDGRKANLYASIGPEDAAGVVLSGHTDVVPVEGQAWSSDPFTMRRDKGLLYGRGTADMKGFIACCIAMAPRAAKLKDKLSAPIHFAFSYDEEIGCVGVRRLIDMLEPVSPKPRCCIIGEPTLMQVVTAHKGKAGERVSCTGLEAHSSLAPTAINAVHLAIDLINEIRRLQAEIAETGTRDGDYDVAYTTLHAGNLHGGETLNIVPNLARFEYEIRHLPADDPQTLIDRIHAKADELVSEARKVFPGADISFAPGTVYPALDTAPDAEVVNYVKSLTGGNSTGKIAFGTEGGLFQTRLGIPTVVCGPGSIGVAHKPDEYIAETEMAACDRMLEKLLEDLTG